jgi:gliding motility-associated-like protein
MAAQCGAFINTFPYTEGFEAGPAWTTGGLSSDWTWGTPNKPIIDGPGGGTRSWVVGGLIGSFYNNGQQSWLESPCFNISSLQYPWISFKVFWETERAYDGMGFQYSLNEGNTWVNLGSFGGTADCLNANWFNSQNITGLNQAQPKQGWSGRQGATSGNCAGGSGSEGWVTASQCLSSIAGATSVKFRFIFGAGTICNGFDGVAVDDIFIGDAPGNAAGFVFACNGTTVDFQDSSTLCPSSYAWNFGDPASGGSNTATGPAASHTFSQGGSYTVSLTVAGPCNATSTTTRTLFIADPEFTVVDPTCSGSDGSITVLLPGAPAGLNYTWSPGGPGGATLSGLGPGTYSVSVDGPDVCGFQEQFVLEQQGDPLVAVATVQPLSCAGANDGSISLLVSGGTLPLSFNWSPSGGNAAVAQGLAPGTYTATITDASGCELQTSATVLGPEPVVVSAQGDVALCAATDTLLSASAQGGTGPYQFVWTPEGPLVSPATTTVYSVVATDANGCESPADQVTVSVGQTITPSFTLDEPLGCTPHCVSFSTQADPGLTAQWTFGDGATADGGNTANHCYTEGGSFTVSLTLTDAAGCSGTTTQVDAVVAVPSPAAAFVPVPSVATIDEPTFQFRDASTNATGWSWSFGDAAGSTSEERDPRFVYPEVGCFSVTLRVANELGCLDSTAAVVCVEDAFVLYAPNAFTPNGDGFNDVFGVVTTVGATDLFELAIYDRWGQQIHSGTALNEGWDGTANGTLVPDGVYAWMVRLRDRTGELRDARGHVTLLR